MKVHIKVHFYLQELLEFVGLIEVWISFALSLERLENTCIITFLKGEFVLLTDKFAKILFNTKIGQQYLTKLISLIVDTPVELLGQNFIPLNPHISVHQDVVSSEADLVYENGDIFVNLEINFHDSFKLNNKNQIYLHQLILRQVSSDKDYTNIKKVYQINLNGYDEFKCNEFIYRSKVIEEKYNIERYDNLEIIDINLYKLYEMDYNLVMEGTDELKKMLYLFVCDDNDLLVRLYEGDRFMKIVLKEANRLKVNIDDLLLYDKEEIKRDVYEAGVKRRNSIEIAVEMLKRNMNLTDVSEITKLALYEVEKLKKTN